MRMPELKALARERKSRGYSRLRKAELIAFLQDNAHQEPQAQRRQRPPRPSKSPPPPLPSGAPSGFPQMFTWEPIDDRLRPTCEARPTRIRRSSFNKKTT